MPGLINAHTHSAMTLFRGFADDIALLPWLQQKIWPAESRLTGEDVFWGALLAILEMLKSGTTCFADMYIFMEEVARAVEVAGIRASLARGMMGTAPQDLGKLEQACELAQAWQGKAGDRITWRLAPHSLYTCTRSFLERVVERSEQLGLGLHLHLAETPTEVREVELTYGQTPVRLLEEMGVFCRPVLAAHCIQLDEEEIAILARRGVGVAHCPESNMKLGSGVAPVVRMLEAGVAVALGTDAAASNNNLDLLQEMRTAALLQKAVHQDPSVLPAYQALELATRGGARALGLDREIGCLTPGRKADLILIDLEKPHLYPRHDLTALMAYSALASDVDTVIVNGEVVVEGGKVLTVDEAEVLREVDRRAKRLVRGLT